MPTRTKSELPDKQSALIRVALKDLRSIEQDPRYTINMYAWMVPGEAGKPCSVCFAGSVMARRFKLVPDASIESLHDLTKVFEDDADTLRKLRALDRLRQGELEGAFKVMGLELPFVFATVVPITSYEESAAGFRRDMNALADSLEVLGY
jgi:hypothetical protein